MEGIELTSLLMSHGETDSFPQGPFDSTLTVGIIPDWTVKWQVIQRFKIIPNLSKCHGMYCTQSSFMRGDSSAYLGFCWGMKPSQLVTSVLSSDLIWQNPGGKNFSGQGLEILHLTADVCQLVCHALFWVRHHQTLPGGHGPLTTRCGLQVLGNMYLSATCPLSGAELRSGTSVLEQVQFPSSKRSGNRTLGCMTYPKAAGKLVKRRDPGALVLRPREFWEGKEQRKRNCVHCWTALRDLQVPEWEVFSPCTSSPAQLLSADLLSYSTRRAILGAGSAGFQAQWGQPQLDWPQEALPAVAGRTASSSAPDLLLLVHTTQVLGRLGT